MCHKVLFWLVIGTPTKESWTKMYAPLNIDTLSVPRPLSLPVFVYSQANHHPAVQEL